MSESIQINQLPAAGRNLLNTDKIAIDDGNGISKYLTGEEINANFLRNLLFSDFFSIATGTNGGDENVALISQDIREKWIAFKAWVFISTNQVAISQQVPEGPRDSLLRFSQVANQASGGTITLKEVSNTAMNNCNSDGMVFGGPGISAPGTGASIADYTGAIYDQSLQTVANMLSDHFLYLDSTTGYLMLHIGTLTAGYYSNFHIKIEVIDYTNV